MIYKVELDVAERATEYDNQRIEMSVHDDPRDGTIVLFTLVEYDETSAMSTSKVLYNFPPISLNDIVRSISAFGYIGNAAFVGAPPYAPSPTRSEDESA